jgi:molybdopterin biosynthesis enzyme
MYDIGLEQGSELARRSMSTLGPEVMPASDIVGRVCARDVIALIDYPSADSSLKDR